MGYRDSPMDPLLIEDEAFQPISGNRFTVRTETPLQQRLATLIDELFPQLPEDEQDCINLKVFGSYSFRDIAIEHGAYLSNGAVNRKWAYRKFMRGLQRIEEMMEEAPEKDQQLIEYFVKGFLDAE